MVGIPILISRIATVSSVCVRVCIRVSVGVCGCVNLAQSAQEYVSVSDRVVACAEGVILYFSGTECAGVAATEGEHCCHTIHVGTWIGGRNAVRAQSAPACKQAMTCVTCRA